MPTAGIILLAALCTATPDAPQINPLPRAVLTETIHQWDFEQDTEGWAAENQCTVAAEDGLLQIASTGNDPFLHCGVDLPGGPLMLVMRVKCQTAGPGRIFWTTDRLPGRNEQQAVNIALQHDGQWHETSATFLAPGSLRDLRFDPGVAPGTCEIDWIRLVRRLPHPLVIRRVDRVGNEVRFEINNDSPKPVKLSVDGQPTEIDANASTMIARPLVAQRPLERVSIDVRCGKYPPLERIVFVCHDDVEGDWIVVPSGKAPNRATAAGIPPSPQPSPGGGGSLVTRVARDGSAARIERDGVLVARLAPLVHCDGKLPELKLAGRTPALRFEGNGVAVSVAQDGDEINVSIDADRACEGPVVRAVGSLEQGLLAGLEYLGKGERSSSKLDIETPEHLRFAPDRLKVTMPLMSFVTDRASVAMTWSDMTLQPIYATPNFFDAADDHRMGLRGKRINATIRVGGGPLTETIRWAVEKQGLPPLPKPPRTAKQQQEFCMQAFNGPLKTEAGWGHCVQERWGRQPFADIASAVWRLSGEVPDLPRIVPGGGHVRNDAIYFVTGRAEEWLAHRKREAQSFIARQQSDGSYRYDGEYRRGHFENTASGVCARPAAMLLEHARATGDKAALEAGLRTLEYMKRFRTPRGAQVWEVPLHTPDQLASAYLVWAYVRGYELTGKQEYLQLARKWALSGVPFTYLWTDRPIMLYSAPPVFGATFWRHSWFGLPVQWVGGVYAYALTLLAPHDDTLDWPHLARGILISAEQQQYPDGDYVGLLPDSFNLPHQRRQPADINPSALVALRMALDGQLATLCVAIDGQHRIVSPYPATIRDGVAHIRAKAGVEYQVVVDGSRVVKMKSAGEDRVGL